MTNVCVFDVKVILQRKHQINYLFNLFINNYCKGCFLVFFLALQPDSLSYHCHNIDFLIESGQLNKISLAIPNTRDYGGCQLQNQI